jgi:hypothetical protein
VGFRSWHLACLLSRNSPVRVRPPQQCHGNVPVVEWKPGEPPKLAVPVRLRPGTQTAVSVNGRPSDPQSGNGGFDSPYRHQAPPVFVVKRTSSRSTKPVFPVRVRARTQRLWHRHATGFHKPGHRDRHPTEPRADERARGDWTPVGLLNQPLQVRLLPRAPECRPMGGPRCYKPQTIAWGATGFARRGTSREVRNPSRVPDDKARFSPLRPPGVAQGRAVAL